MKDYEIDFKEKPESKVSKVFSIITTVLLVIFLVIMGMIMFFYFSTNSYTISGESMAPTLKEKGERCFVSNNQKGSYGDIVDGYSPQTTTAYGTTGNTHIIKRFIADSGDKVGFYFNQEKNLYELAIIYSGSTEINIIDESSYLTLENLQGNSIASNNLYTLNIENKTFEDFSYNEQQIKFLVVPENYCFLLGDNRAVSYDSSSYGAISKNVSGNKVVLVVEETDFIIFEIFKYCFGFRGILE